MTLLDKMHHSHGQASSEPAQGTASASSNQSREDPPAYSPSAQKSSQRVSGSGRTNAPLPQDATRPYPQYQSQMQNAGMTAGAVVGAMGEGSMVGDMMTGGVVGGIVGQRVAQAQNHAFYRDQAMQYREGRAAGTIPPPEEVSNSEKGREVGAESKKSRRNLVKGGQ
ncbi:unnamed protein product [Clonostachys rosea]|uniref:Glycine zipper 2TM domain-containing protein n=1 Tax=Bionectria ochroleuca TaxID=29856 RepID=A0ABY6U993_BIOOC|nr:unnamed protein product [Clonostachys rosea]